MVIHAAVESGPVPVDWWVALVFLGACFLVVASYSWWQRNVFAATVRQDFERKGMPWLWSSRLMPDGRWRKIAFFFAIFYGVLGVLLVVAGIVVLAVESWPT